MLFSIKGLKFFYKKQFYDLSNSFDKDLKFIIENPRTTLSFLDI